MQEIVYPYQLLGVPDKADIKVCNKAFRKLARELHPDVTKDPEKNKKFILLNNIMDFLRDPEKSSSWIIRSQYNKHILLDGIVI